MMLQRVFRDLFRRPYWDHCDPYEYASPHRSRAWWGSFTFKPYPWLGGDEWCHWTLVLPTPVPHFRQHEYYGCWALVISLWSCRDPQCEACQMECVPLSQ